MSSVAKLLAACVKGCDLVQFICLEKRLLNYSINIEFISCRTRMAMDENPGWPSFDPVSDSCMQC